MPVLGFGAAAGWEGDVLAGAAGTGAAGSFAIRAEEAATKRKRQGCASCMEIP